MGHSDARQGEEGDKDRKFGTEEIRPGCCVHDQLRTLFVGQN
jgi:hypothetical protein